jgi:hypothetical protein
MDEVAPTHLVRSRDAGVRGRVSSSGGPSNNEMQLTGGEGGSRSQWGSPFGEPMVSHSRRQVSPPAADLGVGRTEVNSMLRDVILSALNAQFGETAFAVGSAPIIAVFPAVCPEVGEVQVREHGNEAVVNVGTRHHAHCGGYVTGAPLAPDERADAITDEVLEFLKDLFNDRILMWERPDGRVGGWARITGKQVGPTDLEGRRWLWSGPLA